MSTPESLAVVQACAFCGRSCADVDGGRGWFHLESQGTGAERAAGDRWAAAGCFAAFAFVVGLVGLGAWSLGEFVVGPF